MKPQDVPADFYEIRSPEYIPDRAPLPPWPFAAAEVAAVLDILTILDQSEETR